MARVVRRKKKDNKDLRKILLKKLKDKLFYEKMGEIEDITNDIYRFNIYMQGLNRDVAVSIGEKINTLLFENKLILMKHMYITSIESDEEKFLYKKKTSIDLGKKINSSIEEYVNKCGNRPKDEYDIKFCETLNKVKLEIDDLLKMIVDWNYVPGPSKKSESPLEPPRPPSPPSPSQLAELMSRLPDLSRPPSPPGLEPEIESKANSVLVITEKSISDDDT